MAGKAAPAMRTRYSEMCEQMLDQMPELFPPKRTIADLDVLKEQTARILDLIRQSIDGATGSPDRALCRSLNPPARDRHDSECGYVRERLRSAHLTDDYHIRPHRQCHLSLFVLFRFRCQ